LWQTKQRTADLLIPYERAITLVLWHQQWLVGDAPFRKKFALKVTHPHVLEHASRGLSVIAELLVKYCDTVHFLGPISSTNINSYGIFLTLNVCSRSFKVISVKTGNKNTVQYEVYKDKANMCIIWKWSMLGVSDPLCIVTFPYIMENRAISLRQLSFLLQYFAD